ncbi:ATP-binding protein [Bradyrhizobium genosp. P]|uniref:ATP-binding protein n=1 Tax=Bradyrhizobium genosp. P TaxID=83641 RepID=UPI003CE969EF
MVDLVAASSEPALFFGPFRLIPSRHLLLDGDTPVRLGSRAFEILVALIEQRGELVSKDALIERVWPGSHIAEGNLKFQVAGLRRALGDGRDGRRYIVASPGQGYRFVAAISARDDSVADIKVPPSTTQHNLPVQLTRLIGRTDVVGKLLEQLATQRLLTIVGSGGTGKTVVALAVAEQLIPAYEHGVWLIDLAPIADPRLVPTALASALTLEVRSDNPLPGLVTALGDKQMLLVLDNCEHVIKAAANLASEVLKGSRRVHVLATSREPLRAPGEYVHRLLPLAVPAISDGLSGPAALRFPAVQLFVERAAATVNEFELSDADASSAGDICRKLDGVPLAIELAAARVNTFGVRGLAARLDDRLRFLTGGLRAAPPRHRGIGATLDWSYQFLDREEQTVFRRLAIFAGGFTEDAVRAVAAGIDNSRSDVADIVADLVTKSVVTADIGDGDVRFRLLETMRAYAAIKLIESGEADALARRHATFFRELLEKRGNGRAADDLAAAHAPEIDNVRAALSWAFGPSGDQSVAAALAAASTPLWLEKSLLTECYGWSEKALDILDAADRGTRLEMVLQTEFGLSLQFTLGVSATGVTAHSALKRASELAESLQDRDYELRALVGLAMLCVRLRDFGGALVLARQLVPIARAATDPIAVATAHSMLGAIFLATGDLSRALTHSQQAYDQNTPTIRRAQIVRYGMAYSFVVARIVLAQAQWLLGTLDRSVQTMRGVVTDTGSGDHPLSLNFALTWCLNTLSYGQLETAEPWITWLKDHAGKHAMSSYYACALGFDGLLHTRRGDIAAGEQLLRACLNGLRQAQFEVLYRRFLGGLAEVLLAAGRLEESLAAIDEALELDQVPLSNWTPEALRIKGDVLVLLNSADTKPAEDLFHQSLVVARRHGALFWELRTTMSLGRLHHSQGRVHEARDLLQSVYARFTEGLATPELQSARRLLDEWDRGEACN